MIRMSLYRRNKEVQAVRAKWIRDYAGTGRLSRQDLEREAQIIRDRWLCRYGAWNANEISLAAWRTFKHVQPVKGDVGTANAKKLSIAVRRLFVRHENPTRNLCAKALQSEMPPGSTKLATGA